MSGPLLRGAFVAFTDLLYVPHPTVVGFQFNPETMTHEWAPGEEYAPERVGRSNPLAVSAVPGETFRFELVLAAGDLIAGGGGAGSEPSTVSSRLAALEMLQYPVTAATAGGLIGTVTASVAAAAGGGVARSIPPSQVPMVLFVWGAGRVLPVRVFSLSVTEKLYDAGLSPTQATATVALRVLTPDELAYVPGPLRIIGLAGYEYTQGVRKAAALLDTSSPVAAIIGMLPV